jgi:ATPase subunit of ABC transporter with duplicated ATPase domains
MPRGKVVHALPSDRDMSHVSLSDLSYSLPDGRLLFSDVSCKVGNGEHAAVVGPNGNGKSTLMRIIVGLVRADEGEVSVAGEVLYMPQDIGYESESVNVRDMLLGVTTEPLRSIGQRLRALGHAAAEGDLEAGIAMGDAIASWSEFGGYQLEATWDEAARAVTGRGLSEIESTPAQNLSGGERKQLVLRVLFASVAEVLLLDEPDNFLDIPAKRWLERLLIASPKTILLISHDRHLLSVAATKVITLEGYGVWLHPGSYVDYDEARERRQESLGDELRRWQEEERRLHSHYRIMKQRAALNYKNAPKADAAETRWRRFVDAGPPPPPVRRRQIRTRLIGADSARVVVRCENVGIDNILAPFDLEVEFGARVALVGPNGSGKTHLLRLLAGHDVPSTGEPYIGNRVSVGYFTQGGVLPDLEGHVVLDVVVAETGNVPRARSALARYGLESNDRQQFVTLSGGEKARLEVLLLELRGSNLLLLDEPTDNLDIDSAVALEAALAEFLGTVIAVSHDRTFLESFERFVLLDIDGISYEPATYETMMAVVTGLSAAPETPQVKRLARE